jgi:hypothetical protein
MQRGVTQLLFSYLPDRTMDWEDGLAIIRLGGTRLSNVWTSEAAKVVLEEIRQYLARWERRGGSIDLQFRELCEGKRDNYTVGVPQSIRAQVLPTLMYCRKCSRIHFHKTRELAKNDGSGLRCRHCDTKTLRQFGIVFVHGCGVIVPIGEYLPTTIDENGAIKEIKFRLRCRNCEMQSDLALETPARSERIRNIKIVCLECRQNFMETFFARCHRCLHELHRKRQKANTQELIDQSGITMITRIKMRATSYRASDAYYPQTLTLLRLDQPVINLDLGSEFTILRQMLPASTTQGSSANFNDSLNLFTQQLKEAVSRGDEEEKEHLLARVRELVKNVGKAENRTAETPASEDASTHVLHSADEELEAELHRAIHESLAFRQSIRTQSATHIIRQENTSSALIIQPLEELCQRLGLRDQLLVEDLPVISASFGYTRRSSTPTYEEDRKELPTRICSFPALDEAGLQFAGKLHLVGTIPILAREGKHEGLFLSLEPERVIRWLTTNQVKLPLPNAPPIVRILHALEKVDRYYDNVERLCPVRRYVFGLVHSLSHLAMRVASRYAGLERTSISEYIFLPLLGCVIFDNSGNFQLGGLRMLIRDGLLPFLEGLDLEATNCLYDPTCIDHKGACHGCIHSPEISCRFFNHGLSRAFLTGGHAPWADVASTKWVTGYWEV